MTEEEKEIFIATEIMGDYKYSNKSKIRTPNKFWSRNGYKLKFIVPAILFAIFYAFMFYLQLKLGVFRP